MARPPARDAVRAVDRDPARRRARGRPRRRHRPPRPQARQHHRRRRAARRASSTSASPRCWRRRGRGRQRATPPRTDDPAHRDRRALRLDGLRLARAGAGQTADHRTDVFSLGVVLYEMVTGAPPFRGRHAVEVLNAVINETPRPISRGQPAGAARAAAAARPRDGEGPARPLPDDGRLPRRPQGADAPAHARDRRGADRGHGDADRAAAGARLLVARPRRAPSGACSGGCARRCRAGRPRSGPPRRARPPRPHAVAAREPPHARRAPLPQPRHEPGRRLLRVRAGRRRHHRARPT